MKKTFFYLFLLLVIQACGDTETAQVQTNEQEKDSLTIVLEQLYEAHGELGDFQFKFRENLYSFRFDSDTYYYTKTVQNDSVEIHDVLTNDGFTRQQNGKIVMLSPEDAARFSESVNSVIYFVCLPLKLTDPAAHKSLVGSTSIMGQSYSAIKVTFDEEGGGKDHEDIFYYWMNNTTHQLDYLAYQYNTNGGGVRFRKAFNSRLIGGMRFQDYINYGAPVGTPLDSLPYYYQANELEELSQIITEDILPL